MTYTVSVYILAIVTDHRIQHEHNFVKGEEEALMEFYGTLDQTMLSMYEIISDGIHYHDVMDPLTKYCSPWLALVFVAYMSFVVFAVLNVVTGVFVETATQTAMDERRTTLMQQMRILFMEAEADGSGTLSFEEFADQIDTPSFENMLKAVDLDVDEAKNLFHLLDIEECGEIEAESFVNGCQRLTGAAKAIELSAFIFEWKRWVHHWQLHADYVENALEGAPWMQMLDEYTAKEDYAV
jgi:hypothetical protein